MGLGLPWLIYCFLAPDGYEVNKGTHTYHGLSATGVVFPTLALLALNLLFILLLAMSGMALFKWHAYLFILMYLGFLVWAITTECAAPF